MVWNELVELEEVKDPVPMAIVGYPGVGNVGTQVISYLSKEMHATTVTKIYSEYLLLSNNVAGVIIQEDGGFKLPSMEIKLARFNSGRLFLVSSPVQPVPWGQLELSSLLLDYLRSKSVEVLFVITGFVERSLIDSILVFGDEEWTKKLQESGSIRSDTIKSVVGLAGANLSMAKIRGLRYVFISGVAENYSSDPGAAKNVLRQLNRVIDLGMDLGEMESGETAYDGGKELQDEDDRRFPRHEGPENEMGYMG